MQYYGFDAWIVPSTDPHQSEYVAECWQARAWLSGFTGSAGTVVVTQTKAGLWTDSRYYIRAAQELAGSGIELFKVGFSGVLTYSEWLAVEMESGGIVGLDGGVFSIAEVERLEKAFHDKSITINHNQDLVGQLWDDRPAIPMNPVFLLDDKFSGETRTAKISRIRGKIKEQGADAHLLSSLDDIAWTLNIRGNDVSYNPVAICYLLIKDDEVRLFIHPEKVSQSVTAALQADGIIIAEYEELFPYLQRLPSQVIVLIDPEKTNYKIMVAIEEHAKIKLGSSIPEGLKAVKNATELAGIRNAHIRDGVAMVRWLYWLDTQIHLTDHTEATIAEKLAELRSIGEHYQGLSFGTISAYQANGAIGHYAPRSETAAALKPEGLLVIDSGGQYLDGTTDITRTICLGSPTREQKRAFTAVLKAHIKLATSTFPHNTQGVQLDAITKEPLWQQGFECYHGIGHGIGHYLNVHEGPQRFSKSNTVPIELGMVSTNEPGVYFEGKFGIRIENVVITVPHATSEFGDFYGFETVSWCPIDIDLIEIPLLNTAEMDWLNGYHQTVYEKLAPYLTSEEKSWLRIETRQV